jgi:hypothetical protein
MFRVQSKECQGGHSRVTKHFGILLKERFFIFFEHFEGKASQGSALRRCKECTKPTRYEVLEEIKENKSFLTL